MAKNSLRILKDIVALHEDGQGYKKIANTLKLSCSTEAKIIQRFKSSESTQNKARVGGPKKLSARAERYIQMLPSTSNWYAWLSPQEEASSEDDTQESLQTVCWRHVNQAFVLLKPCPMVWWDED